MPPPQKTKADRLKETIRLLKELQRVGFHTTDPGYVEIQAHMTKWVNEGEAFQAVVPFIRHGRDAEINLPSRADRAASINLKVVNPPIE